MCPSTFARPSKGPYAKSHTNKRAASPKRPRSPPKVSALEKAAIRMMRKVYEATGGQPQRWELLYVRRGSLPVFRNDFTHASIKAMSCRS